MNKIGVTILNKITFSYTDKQTPSISYYLFPTLLSSMKIPRALETELVGFFGIPHKHARSQLRPRISTLNFFFKNKKKYCMHIIYQYIYIRKINKRGPKAKISPLYTVHYVLFGPILRSLTFFLVILPTLANSFFHFSFSWACVSFGIDRFSNLQKMKYGKNSLLGGSGGGRHGGHGNGCAEDGGGSRLKPSSVINTGERWWRKCRSHKNKALQLPSPEFLAQNGGRIGRASLLHCGELRVAVRIYLNFRSSVSSHYLFNL